MSRRRERGKKAERISRWHRDQVILKRQRDRRDFERQLDRQARIARAFGIDRSHEIMTDRSGGFGVCKDCGASYLNAEIEPALLTKCRGRQGLLDKLRPVGDKWKDMTIEASCDMLRVCSGDHRVDFHRTMCRCNCSGDWKDGATSWFAWLARDENDDHKPACPRCGTQVWHDGRIGMTAMVEGKPQSNEILAIEFANHNAMIRASVGTPEDFREDEES